MATIKDLQDIPNAPQPTPGQGLTLDINGLLPPKVLAATPTDQYALIWDDTLKRPKWAQLASAGILDGTIVNADVSASAAIAYSKLNLASSIVDADVSGSAAIAQSKIAFDAWQSYTPVWTSNGTAPVLGNGTIVGKYNQIGKTIVGRMLLTMGSTTTFGTGVYFFSLPVTAAAGETADYPYLGTANAQHTGTFPSFGFVGVQTTTQVVLYTPAQPGVGWGPAVPITWANTDRLSFRFAYEAA